MEEKTSQENVKEEGQKHSSKSSKSDLKGLLAQLEAMLDKYLVKEAPFTLPKEAKEFVVSVSPYLVIVFAVLALPLIFGAIGLTAVLTPFAMMGGYGHVFGWGLGATIGLIISVITVIIEVMAVPGLFKRTKGAWRLLFYASIVSLIGGVLSIGGIVSAIIGAVIGWYILFQVKELYKN